MAMRDGGPPLGGHSYNRRGKGLPGPDSGIVPETMAEEGGDKSLTVVGTQVNVPISGDGFAKAVGKLTGFLGKVAGTVLDPVKLVLMAKAEDVAKTIDVKGELARRDLIQRAEDRVAAVEVTRQQNLETVVSQLPRLIRGPVSDSPVDPDWGAQFRNYAQDVSDREMQSLWANILAGEATKPGSYSRRTLNAVHLMTKEDANLFTKLCGVVWRFANARGIAYPGLPNLTQVVGMAGVALEDFLHLIDIGLVEASETIRYGFQDAGGEVEYAGKKWRTEKWAEGGMSVNYRRLTQIGSELAPISGAVAVPAYEKMVIDELFKAGVKFIPLQVQPLSELSK